MFIIRHRWWIVVITILIIAGSVIPLFNIKINADLESYMPDSMKSKVNNKQIGDVFGNEESLLIILESQDVLRSSTLKRIRDLSNAFSNMSDFEQVFSLFQTKNIRSEEGTMVVDPVVGNIPEDDASVERLRKNIMANDLAYGLVVSSDFRYALIMLTTNRSVDDKSIIDQVRQTLKKIPGDEKVYISGQPYLRAEANDKIGHDIMVLLPIGLLVMVVFLWFSFREIKAVLLPFSVVIISILISMALIPAFNWELSLIGVLIPIMMIAITNNYGVYVVSKYQEINAKHPGRSMYKIIQETIVYFKTPIILCGLTTMVGIMGLVVHLLLPASQMGVVAAIGIGFALLLSLMYIPALMSFMKKSKPHKGLGENARGFFHNMLYKTGNFITTNPKFIVACFAFFFTICSFGIFHMRIAPDSNKVLPAKHDFNVAIGVADKYFGGSKVINVMFNGDAIDPGLLKRIEYYESELNKLPQVGRTASLATLIKRMSTALNDSSELGYNAIPESREAVAQYLELYSMNADAADFERFVNFDYTKTLMTVQYHAANLNEVDKLLSSMDDLLKEEPAPFVVGGFSLIDKELSESVKTGQYYSLLVAFIAILILLSIIFRSIIAGFMGSLPLVFAVFCTFGLMGWIGIELNIVTALLSSISIGLGVDFTIHIFWRLKYELSNGKNWIEAVKSTEISIGRGISINAFSVMIGFSVLFLSAFPLIQSFGFLIIISLFFCLICALILIPALCLIFKPEFLQKKNVRIKNFLRKNTMIDVN